MRGDGFDDTFGGDAPDPGPYEGGLHIDPRILVGLIVLGLCVLVLIALAHYTGKVRGRRKLEIQRKESAEAIYRSVRWHLDRALRSSGAVILERAREVSEIIEARLGFVIALNGKPGKIVGEVKTALAGEKSVSPPDPTPKVKVALATEAHYLEVWKALHEFNTLWQDKPRVMQLIEAAQRELSEAPLKERPPVVVKLKPEKVVVAKPVAVAAAVPVKAEEVPAPAPTPPPPPPAPAPKTGKKLPKHKRNMLA